MSRRIGWGVLLLLLVAWPAVAQEIEGVLFDDRDGDGVRDAGEPALEGVDVRLYGTATPSVGVDQTEVTGSDGSYAFSPGDGCYLIAPIDPPGWRMSPTRSDRFPQGFPGYLHPVGQPRFAKLDRAIGNLQAGTFRQSALGDSIAANFSTCDLLKAFWYSKQLQSRLGCVSGVSVSLDQAAELGEHTDDLLVDQGDLNNVFRMIDVQPDLITLSMIGNDMLNVDPGDSGNQQDTNVAVAEVLDARQNLQEALSAFVSEIPDADVVLNTLYDNEADNCDPSNFHRVWLPIVNRLLRDLAWGQMQRASVNEVAAEFAQLDQGGECTGFQGMICQFFDGIHPNQSGGYAIIAEKLWEAAGGVRLGPDDALDRPSLDGVDYGYLRHVRRLLPTAWEVRDGASVTDPADALSDQDDGAPARITLGNGTEEFRLSGFPDWYDEVRIVRVIAGVRYRTRGTVVDDLYRMEASVTDQFRPPPGFAYTPTHWNFFTPIVGAGGPSQPAENPDYPSARTLVRPEVLDYREVSATLNKNPTLPPAASDYEWPALTHEDLATTAIRVVAAPDPGAAGDDAYRVELDYAWLDLYGWETDRPPAAEELRVARRPDGTLDVEFDAVAGAQRYNLYTGRLSTVTGGIYDHGAGAAAGPFCDTPTQAAGPGRVGASVAPIDQPAESLYLLVTAHVDDVESPAGYASGAIEIDRSQSTCR